MSAYALPQCATTCITNALVASKCSFVLSCLCQDQRYLAAARLCLRNGCTPAEQQQWDEFAIQQCALAGVPLVSSSIPTPATTEVATNTLTVLLTTNVLVSSIVTNLVATATQLDPSGFGAPPLSTNSANPVSGSSGTSPAVVASQPSNNGLSTGGIVGIAVGAIALILIAVVVAFLLWRRHRGKRRDLPEEPTTTVHEVEAVDRDDTFGKEAKMGPTVGISSPPEQTRFAGNNGKPAAVPELSDDGARLSNIWSSPETGYSHELSPSSAYTELTATGPSEVGAAIHSPPEYASYDHNSPKGAGSIGLNYNAHPAVPELGNQTFGHPYEMSSSPHMSSSLPIQRDPRYLAQKISSSPALRPTAPYSGPLASPLVPLVASTARYAGTDGAGGDVDIEGDDTELNRMKAEIEAVRVEKERVQQSLEARERDLSRKIVERELRGAGGGPS